MTIQRIHPALGPIDLLTRIELEETITSHMDRVMRDRYRGLDSARFPQIQVQGTGGTITLPGGAGNQSDGYIGPEQGDVWMLRRAIVSPSVLTGDPALYLLFRGSTPSDPGQYTGKQLLDGMVYSGTALGQHVGVGYNAANKAVLFQPGEQLYAMVLNSTVGVTYTLSGEAIRVPAEMKGKVIG